MVIGYTRSFQTPDAAVASPEIQQKYLEQVHYILDKGLEDLIGAVLKATEDVIREYV